MTESEHRDHLEVPLRIHTCDRIGMKASPPRTSLTDWLRRGLTR